MHTIETQQGTIRDDKPRELGRLFFDLVRGATEAVTPARIKEVEKVWDGRELLVLSQGAVRGTFNEESVRFILGRTVGVAITLQDAEGITQGSNSVTELLLTTTGEGPNLRPAFSITPLPAE